MGTTIVELAKRAGVSVATISLVISDHPRISQATKEKVRALMKELGYSPNSIARGLVNKTPTTIGVVMPLEPGQALRHPSMFEMLSGMENGLREGGFQLLLINWDVWTQSPNELLELWRQKRVDGFILQATPPLFGHLDEWKELGLPFVMIGQAPEGHGADWVDVDNHEAGAFAWSIIRQAGYLNPGFVALEGDGIQADRAEGFKAAAFSDGLSPPLFICPDPSSARIVLGAGARDCDALVCGSHYVALVLNDGARGILSFDDLPYMSYTTPTISTIDIEVFSLGKRAAEAILWKLANPSESVRDKLALFRYLSRESTVRRALGKA